MSSPLQPPNLNLCVMFFSLSLVTPPLVLFLPPPPSNSPHPRLLLLVVGEGWGRSQNNNKQTAWFLLFLVAVVAAEVLSLSSSRLRMSCLFASCGWMMQASRPVQMCAVAPCYTGWVAGSFWNTFPSLLCFFPIERNEA